MTSANPTKSQVEEAEARLALCERVLSSIVTSTQVTLPWHLESAARRSLAEITEYQGRWGDLVITPPMRRVFEELAGAVRGEAQ